MGFLIGGYLAKLPARRWLSRALCAPGHHIIKTQIARDNFVLGCNFAKYSAIIFFTDRLSNELS